MDTTIVPFLDAGGTPYQYIAIRNDITALKNAEEALHRSEEQQRVIMDSLPVLVSYVDKEERYRFCNKTYEEWFGHTKEELVGKHLKEVLGEEAYEEIRPKAAAALSGTHVSYEARIPYKNAGPRYVHVDYIPHGDRQGQIQGFFALIYDMTEREAAESAVRSNAQRLRAVLRQLPLAALLLDERGGILEVNSAFSRLWGDFPFEQHIGGNIWNFIHSLSENVPDARGAIVRFGELLSRKQPVLGREEPLLDGRILLQDYIPIFENGRHIGDLFLLRDVTAERRADKTKTEFVNLASHQLRTPLTGLRWMMGRLRTMVPQGSNPAMEHLLEEGKRLLSRMAETINVMLSISQLESGKHRLIFSDVRMCPFLKTCLEPFQKEISEKSLSVSIECAGDVAIRTDERCLRELLDILISNAVKYSERDDTVTLIAGKTDDGYAVSVRDTGYGIPQHEQEKVFQKFFRGSNVLNKDPNGTGLGLYLASLIASALHGKLTFLSTEGEGSTFTLLLPECLED